MKQKKRVWMSFNLWEANVFEQYLEEMAAQGWFLESVGGSVMKFHRAEPAKRRYAALLVPGSSSLTGADSWKAEQFRKQCQEAGWNFECSGTFWQIFYTTDDAVERTGDKGAAGGYTAAGQKYSGKCGSRVRKNGSTGRTYPE